MKTPEPVQCWHCLEDICPGDDVMHTSFGEVVHDECYDPDDDGPDSDQE